MLVLSLRFRIRVLPTIQVIFYNRHRQNQIHPVKFNVLQVHSIKKNDFYMAAVGIVEAQEPKSNQNNNRNVVLSLFLLATFLLATFKIFQISFVASMAATVRSATLGLHLRQRFR